MQIVKIFPNSKEKCHFSIRKHNNKYYVFEGDKVLRTELDNFASAETEISLIILARRQHGVKEVPVSYTEVGVVVNQIAEDKMPEQRKCKQCQTEFTAFGKGGTQKIYCSEKCRTKFNNQLKVENLKLTELNETGNLRERKCKGCKQMFQPKKSNSYNCSQKCSQKSYQQKKRKEKQKQLKEQIINESEGQFKHPFTGQYTPIENIENQSLKMPTPVDELFTMKTIDVNEFHELTEKQMKLESRLKRVKALASDMVDYIVVWCDVNKSFGHAQDYNSMLHNLVKMNLVDLSKKEIVSVMPELIEWYDSGYVSVHSIDSKNQSLIQIFKERLRELIIAEQVIPTEEQFNKSYTLRLLISQLHFLNLKQQETLDPFNRQQPIEREYTKETPVEINKLTDAINVMDEKIEVLMTNQILLSEQSKIVTEVLKTISERVSKITQKRRGLFG